MTFGERVKVQRRRNGMSQDDLAAGVGVSRRTITSWETGKAFPRTRQMYAALAGVLHVPVNYFLSEEDAFILEAEEQFGYRGRKGAERLTRELTALFAGGELAEEDMDALMFAVQQAYVDAKRKNKKYTPKKYLEDFAQPEESQDPEGGT